MKKSNLVILNIITFLLLVVSLLSKNNIEMFIDNYVLNDATTIPSIATRVICPTRMQSYDIRQDIPIERHEWRIQNSELGPMNPKQCLNKSIFE